MTPSIKFILALVLSSTLIACGTDTSSGSQGSSSSGASSAVTVTKSADAGEQTGGELSLRLTDAPIDDAARVVVTFTAIEMKHKRGPWVMYTFDTPQAIDILQYHGTSSANLLANVGIEPGIYKRIRLFVSANPADNYIELRSGGVEPLDIPGGSTKGLKLNGTFDIPANRPARFTIDIDLRQSIVTTPSGQYQMKLKYRVVRNDKSGHIRGVVDPLRLVDRSCSDADVDSFNAIYVFKGHAVKPTDINQHSRAKKGPITTSPVQYDPSTGSYLYEAAYLRAGKYTVAFTCNADQDDLDADDDLKFFNIRHIKVLVNDTVFLK